MASNLKHNKVCTGLPTLSAPPKRFTKQVIKQRPRRTVSRVDCPHNMVQADVLVCSASTNVHEIGNTEFVDNFKDMTGMWKKQRELCSSMEDTFRMLNIPWIIQQAVAYLPYLKVEITDKYLKTVVKAGGILDIVEVYPWTGEKRMYPRRDKKKGKHNAWVVCTDKGPYVEMTWGKPYPGWSRDTFELSSDKMQLTMTSQVRLADTGEECEYKMVFKRV